MLKSIVLAILAMACSGSGFDARMDGAASTAMDGRSRAPDVLRLDVAMAPDLRPAARPVGSLDLGHAPEPVPVTPPPVYDVNHVLSTGQSLSLGYNGVPVLSTSQPHGNLKFNTGNFTVDFPIRFDPLVEVAVETMSSGLANRVAELAGPGYAVLTSIHGVSNTAYAGLAKGTDAYAHGMQQVRYGASIAAGLGKSYAVRAVTAVHGESDQSAGTTDYAADVIQWQADYEADVRAITGQPDPVPMFHSQVSSWTMYGAATPTVARAQLAASYMAPERVVLVGAKYHLPYSDGIHLTNEGYRQLGEMYGRAIHRVVVLGQRWVPLRMRAAARAGSMVTVRFDVPAPPMMIDTAAVSDPGHYGFEVAGGGAIAGVDLAGPDAVALAVSGPVTHVRYAFTGVVGAHAGPTTGPRGNVRDSEGNWAVHQEMAVE